MPFRSLLLIAFSILVGPLFCQTETAGKKIVFHVSSVEQEKAPEACEGLAQCNAIRYTVGGNVVDGDAAIEYVLECVEVSTQAQAVWRCPHLHAHADYDAALYSVAIIFASQPPAPNDRSKTVGYMIKSEKEIRKK
jgi:hypothetical protein